MLPCPPSGFVSLRNPLSSPLSSSLLLPIKFCIPSRRLHCRDSLRRPPSGSYHNLTCNTYYFSSTFACRSREDCSRSAHLHGSARSLSAGKQLSSVLVLPCCLVTSCRTEKKFSQVKFASSASEYSDSALTFALTEVGRGEGDEGTEENKARERREEGGEGERKRGEEEVQGIREQKREEEAEGEESMTMLGESSVGIRCFVAEGREGFEGVLKQRYSDFLVHEVDECGETVKLNSLSVPQEVFQAESSFCVSLEERVGEMEEAFSVEETVGSFLSQFGERGTEDGAKLREFLNRIKSGGDGAEDLQPLLLSPSADKKFRTSQHSFFKSLPFLVTDSVDGDAGPPERSVRVRYDCKPKNCRRASMSKEGAKEEESEENREREGEGHAVLGNAGEEAREGEGAKEENCKTEEESDRKRQKRSERDSGGWREKRKKGRERGRERGRDASLSSSSSLYPEFDTRGRKGAEEGATKSSGQKFLHFSLLKENKDTNEAIALLCRYLGIQPRSIGFAGTKDKRAITVQRVSLPSRSSLPCSRIAELNKRLYGIRVGNFSLSDRPLTLGMLGGNRFTVTLRAVTADADSLSLSADELGKRGFINYFGLQRFGVGFVPTHHVGAALLKGDWSRAISLILDPRGNEGGGEPDDVAAARNVWKTTKDADVAYVHMPKRMTIERALLSGLKKHPRNFPQALTAIPRTMRMMYVHSYQSFLWNNAASARIEKFGSSNVVEGDLVLLEKDKIADVTISPEDALLPEPEESIPEKRETNEKPQVKVLSAEDVIDGGYSIWDVVLPLPGRDVIPPANDVAHVYHALAHEDGIDLLNPAHKIKEYSLAYLTGGYRRIMQRPKDFEWRILQYSSPTTPLCSTDLDSLALLEQKPSLFLHKGFRHTEGAFKIKIMKKDGRSRERVGEERDNKGETERRRDGTLDLVKHSKEEERESTELNEVKKGEGGAEGELGKTQMSEKAEKLKEGTQRTDVSGNVESLEKFDLPKSSNGCVSDEEMSKGQYIVLRSSSSNGVIQGGNDPYSSSSISLPFTALQLSFSLPPSSYATMAIRELTRMPTGSSYHKALEMTQKANQSNEEGEEEK